MTIFVCKTFKTMYSNKIMNLWLWGKTTVKNINEAVKEMHMVIRAKLFYDSVAIKDHSSKNKPVVYFVQMVGLFCG